MVTFSFLISLTHPRGILLPLPRRGDGGSERSPRGSVQMFRFPSLPPSPSRITLWEAPNLRGQRWPWAPSGGPSQPGSIAAKANERVSVRAPPKAPAKNAGQQEELQGEEGQPQPCPDRPSRPHSCPSVPGGSDRGKGGEGSRGSWGLTPPEPGRQKRHPKEWDRHEVLGKHTCLSSSQTSKCRSRWK